MKITLYSEYGWVGLDDPSGLHEDRVITLEYPIGKSVVEFQHADQSVSIYGGWGVQYAVEQILDILYEVVNAAPRTQLVTICRPFPEDDMCGAQPLSWQETQIGSRVWLDHYQDGIFPTASPHISGPYIVINQEKCTLLCRMPGMPVLGQTFRHPHENMITFPDYET